MTHVHLNIIAELFALITLVATFILTREFKNDFNQPLKMYIFLT